MRRLMSVSRLLLLPLPDGRQSTFPHFQGLLGQTAHPRVWDGHPPFVPSARPPRLVCLCPHKLQGPDAGFPLEAFREPSVQAPRPEHQHPGLSHLGQIGWDLPVPQEETTSEPPRAPRAPAGPGSGPLRAPTCALLLGTGAETRRSREAAPGPHSAA